MAYFHYHYLLLYNIALNNLENNSLIYRILLTKINYSYQYKYILINTD